MEFSAHREPKGYYGQITKMLQDSWTSSNHKTYKNCNLLMIVKNAAGEADRWWAECNYGCCK